MNSTRSLVIIVALILSVIGVGYWYLGGASHKKMPPPPPVESVLPKEFLAAYKQQKGGAPVASRKSAKTAPSTVAAATPAATAAPAVETAKFTSGGQGKLHINFQNPSDKPTQFTVHPGDIYDTTGGVRVVVLEACDRTIPPHGLLETDVRTASATVAEAAASDVFNKSSDTIPKLDLLLTQWKAQPELSPVVMQTAILLLAQNPSLDIFAKFPRTRILQSITAPETFKVDTVDIISALQMLAETGVNDRTIAADPQLKIEAMIDPKAHDLAMHYYGITPETEWAYWKHQLLEGEPSMRHYALYGIARNYPDVALQMLPKWAREARLQPIYRLSAVRAMAMTHRAEAIPILQKLEQEFAPDSDLHQSADRASKYLSSQFNQQS